MTLAQNPPVTNRGPVPIASIPTPIVYGSMTPPQPPIQWVQVTSVGSGGLVVKDERGNTQTYSGASALVAGETIYGPFSELTSMTLGGILVGDGRAPTFTSATVAAPPAASLAPFLAVAVANQATLSGLSQTVDGVALNTAGMRVYLANQTTTTQNGAWLVQSGNWTRPADWTGTIPLGTTITVAPGGTSNFAAFGGEWYVDSASGVVDTGTIVAYPRVCKGTGTLASASPSTVVITGLWIKGTIASGATSLSLTNATTAANGVKGVLVAGAGTGTLTITGPNTVTDVISYTITNG